MSSEELLFDEAICQTATFADLDIEQVRAFLQKKRVLLQKEYQAGLSEREQMQEFGWLQGDHPSYGALLCFGKSPSLQVAGAYTRCIYWWDSKRLSGWVDDKEYRGNLLQQFAQARDFLQKHLNFGRIIGREGSHEQPEIPFRVLEEVLANALIHREYATAPSMPRVEEMVVEILSNRIEISSPGGPPAHVSLDALQNAQEKHPGSHPRNPQIMRIFYLAGLAEHAGAGIEQMQHYTQQAGLQQPQFNFNPVAQTLIVTLLRPAPLPPPESELLPVEQSRSRSISPVPAEPPQVRQRPRFFWILLAMVTILVLIGSLVVGARISESYGYSPPASTIIRIASDFPTTSLEATAGLPLQNGVQMAINEATLHHLLPGYTLQLTAYDDVGMYNVHDPQKGADNIRKAVADNLVAGIIGPRNSSVAQEELPIANRAPIALLSPSAAYPCLTKGKTNDPDCTGNDDIQTVRPTDQLTFFRLVTTEDQQGKAAADFLFNQKHYRKVILIKDDNDAYNRSLAKHFLDEWTQLGGEVDSLNLPEPSSSVTNYRDALQKRASDHPDLIYFAGNIPNGTYVLQALSNIPALNNVAFAGGGAIVVSSFLEAAAQLHPNAPIYASLAIQDPAHTGTLIGTDFEANYNANYSNYQPLAASAYDCTMMLIQAIKIALRQVSTPHGPQDRDGAIQFRKAIVQALAHLSYTGATGTHRFDANGDTNNHTVSFYQLDLSSHPNWQWLEPPGA